MNIGQIKSRDELVSSIVDALSFDRGGEDAFFYVSLTRNAVLFYYNDLGEPAPNEDYIVVNPLKSWEVFRGMERFVDVVENPEVQNALSRGLSRNHPFANFRYAVEDAGLMQQWNAFHSSWLMEQAEEWLRDHGVDFVDGHVTAPRRRKSH